MEITFILAAICVLCLVMFGGDDATDLIKQQEAEREAAITTGMGKINAAFAGYTPAYYDAMKAASLATLMPQIGRQYRSTKRQLTSALSDTGLTKSSASRDLGESLEVSKGEAVQQAVDSATQASQALQQQVEAAKGSVTNQLVATQNPTAAATAATGAAASLSAPPALAPIANLGQTWANIYLAGQVRNAMPQFNTLSIPTPGYAGAGAPAGGGSSGGTNYVYGGL